jgi:succinoglycan biosynthesis protein ExoM
MRANIDVCVATYRRPHLLEKLLMSLACQTVRDAAPYRIIVVDNDRERSAEEVVAAFRHSSGLDVIYAVAETQGISYARNLALRHATAPLVAFIDDDEHASPTWLERLTEALELHEADAVFGPVVPEFPSATPGWAVQHPAFIRPRQRTGTIIASGASGNVLLKRTLLERVQPWFDPQYARTGGEDTEFFARASACGGKLVWCDEAEVTESVPVERLTRAWVCRRAFRGGRTFFSIFVRPRTPLQQAWWLAQRGAACVIYLTLLPAWWLQGQAAFAMRLSRLCGWVGQLSQIFGDRFTYEEYRGRAS